MKESRHVYISVEGDVCERLYFEHLKKLINSDKNGTYNLNLSIRKENPYSFIKRNAYKQMDKEKGKIVPVFHIQDVEDYSDNELRNRFKEIIDDMHKAENEFRIPSQLGFSNYTFELWMLLHVKDMTTPVGNRQAYLKHINKYFIKKYQGLEEYKEEKEFQDILNKYVTLDTIFDAINRADKISKQKERDKKRYEHYRKYTIYPDNPYTTVQHVVSTIFSLCGIKKP